MVNYEVDAAVVARHAPRGTRVDHWDGRCLVSLVGFLFERTRVRGLAIPFHSDFEELNLRFYAGRDAPEGLRRGVVFVKEIVPRFWIAKTARVLYNENYVALPMRHSFEPSGEIRYEWKHGGRWNSLAVSAAGDAALPAEGSEEEFITEHYWGYVAGKDGVTREYRVEHPRWRVWRVREAQVDCDAEGLYGAEFGRYLRGRPHSAFLAEGSAVSVYPAAKL
jgi:hypothetical protein